MPCYDDRPRQQAEEDAKARAFAEAALCALMRATIAAGVLEKVMDAVDFPSAGITHVQLGEWWKQHQAKDARRGKA